MKTDHAMTFDAATGRLLMVLSQHLGPENAIGMDTLYEQVFGARPTHKINHTKQLRRLITVLRNKGVPIGSVCRSSGGGYYQVRAGSELEEYRLRMLRRPALRKLAMDARLGKIALPELLGQISLRLNKEKP